MLEKLLFQKMSLIVLLRVLNSILANKSLLCKKNFLVILRDIAYAFVSD
jgi:hypothetical protein